MYNTGNPLGSTDPRDLFDNAVAFDNALNSSALRFTDRFGVSRPTWAASGGYFFLGDYDADIEITGFNQVVLQDGEYWKLATDQTLPYTTTGSWSTDSVDFVSVGDAVLRQDLGDSSDPARGYNLVAITITDQETASAVSVVNPQYQPGDPRRYGAVGDGVTDDSVALQRALDSGHSLWLGGKEMVYIAQGLTLEDGETYNIAAAGAMLKLKANATSDLIVNDDTTFVHRLTMFGVVLDGNLSNQSGWAVGGINVRVEIAEIVANTFQGFKPYSLRLAHVAASAKVHDNTFQEGAEHGGSLNQNSIYLECRTSSTRPVSDEQVISIKDNTFRGIITSTPGYGVGGVILSGHSAAAPDETHRATIQGNTFYDCGQDAEGNKTGAITFYRRVGRSIVTGNWIYGGGENGIDIQGSDNVIVSDNEIHGVAVDAIVVAQRDGDKTCDDVSIHDNIISNCQTGIRPYFAEGLEGRNISVCHNNIRNVEQAIECRYCDGTLTIQGNVIDGVTEAAPSLGERAIDVYLCDASVSIVGNNINDSANSAIAVRAGSGATLVSENIINDCAEIRPISIRSMTGDVAVHGNILTNVVNDVIEFDGCTGRISVEANVMPIGSTLRMLNGSEAAVGPNVGLGPQTIAGAGAISPSIPTTLLVTSGSNALTLADGVENQRKAIVMKTDGGVGTLTPANLKNGTTITFDDVGDSADLYFTDGAWVFMGGTATLA